MTRSRTLVVTNDFPPRQGGIETFVHAMTSRFATDSVVVYTSAEPGAAAHDAALPHPVVRDPARTLLPVPRVAARAVEIARRHGCDSVWFGAAAPLGLLADRLRRESGVRRAVATTHGHEVWWARTPGARTLLRRIGDRTDTVTYLGEATRAPIAAALGPAAARRMVRLAPGVDAEAFRVREEAREAVRSGARDGIRPPAGGVRERYGLGGRPVILCAARLVPRKGQDTLIRALPAVLRAVPDAVLLLTGDGPYARTLHRLAADTGVADAVVLAAWAAARGDAGALRGLRRLRHALPHPQAGPGGGGAGHRLPGGRRLRAAGPRRRLGRRAGHRTGRGDRTCGRRA